jgi:SAM-dependent methyltransferase
MASLEPMTPACTICGETRFQPGPNGRQADSGRLPCCTGCGALERQRIVRRIFEAFPLGFLDWRKGLQFSPDNGIDPRWFRAYEVSVYGGDNSLDIQQIDRPDQSYDFISFNHVLEFVPDDRRAFAEMVRVLGPEGVIQAGFSTPLSRECSEDYRTPFGPHQAWHLYGRDLALRFANAHGLGMLAVSETDPCTGAHEVFHLFFKRPADAMRTRAWLSAWSNSVVVQP